MRLLASLAASACAAVALSASAAVVYDSNTTTGADGAFFNTVPGFMQVVTLNSPNVPQTINSFTVFGIRYNAAITSGTSALILEFYTNVDTSAGAVDSLATATLAGSVGYNLPGAAAGSYNFTLPGVNVTIPGNTVAVAAYLTNPTATAYTTNLGGRYSTGTPTVGSNDGFVYNDTNGDFIFAGSERTQFLGATSAAPVPTNVRMAIDVTVPEPASLSMLGLTGLALLRRRKA